METELAEIRADLRGAAYARQRDATHIRDDLVQEGLLIAWAALQEGQTVALAKWRGRQRMDVLLGPERREKWTGHVHTGAKDPLRQVGITLSLDALPRDEWTEDVQPEVDVHTAVRRLPLQHKEIVYRKFWLDETYEEIGQSMNMHKQTVFNVWARSIRPRLRIELAHLCNTGVERFDSGSHLGKVSVAVGAGVLRSPAPPGGRTVPTVQGAA